MAPIEEIKLGALYPERFRDLLGDRYTAVENGMREARELFAGRVVWHVNSTARGGGVAELLQSLLAYARGAGVDARWIVVGGEPQFFALTKRIHNLLHGVPGDGDGLGDADHVAYERALEPAARALAKLVRPGDVVFLHDPQTAGMLSAVRATGASVVWRCHVGIDEPNELARGAWKFLAPYIEEADAFVFSRREFVWDGLPKERVWVVPPSIDVFSPKNQELSPTQVAAILARARLADGAAPGGATFVRRDGSPGRVDRPAEIDQDELIPSDAPLVTQVSRWDRLKDPVGVLGGFADHLRHPDAHLLLAGPSVTAVADDPEGAGVLAEVRSLRGQLPPERRRRVHLATLPMDDVQENAAMVNAIQRRSEIVVQKSLAEGFGLTISEAMWKARPIVASGLGGIRDQIVDGKSGRLLARPSDLPAFAAVLDELLFDPALRSELGANARQRVEDDFLGTRHLIQYLELLATLLRSSRR
jgi:trehalose synthase